MPIPLIAGAVIGLCKVCAIAGAAIFCTHKVTKAYQKGQKTKQQKITAKSQTDMAKIDAAQKRVTELQNEINEQKKKYDELEEKIKNRDKEIEEASRKAKDPNLSEEERRKWKNKLVVLTSQQEDDKRERSKILAKIEELTGQIKKQDNIIGSTGTGSYEDNHHWVFNLFTLENFLILGGCYVLYKLVKDDK